MKLFNLPNHRKLYLHFPGRWWWGMSALLISQLMLLVNDFGYGDSSGFAWFSWLLIIHCIVGVFGIGRRYSE